MSTATTSLVDFLILAPLKEEREAVLAHLGHAQRLQPDEQDVRVYYQTRKKNKGSPAQKTRCERLTYLASDARY